MSDIARGVMKLTIDPGLLYKHVVYERCGQADLAIGEADLSISIRGWAPINGIYRDGRWLEDCQYYYELLSQLVFTSLEDDREG